MNMKQQRSPRNVSFLVASIAIHFGLMLFLSVNSSNWSSTEIMSKKKTEPSVQFIDLADMDKVLDRALVEQDEKEKPSKEKPKDAKFMSKVDKDVEKESVAVNKGDFQNKNSQAQPPAKTPGQEQDQKKSAAAEQAQMETPEMKTFAGGDMVINGKKVVVKKAKSLSDLQAGSMAEMTQQAFAAVSQNNDYIKDVVAGAETHLKTREFLYYTYFNRIKKKLRENWEPIIHDKVRVLHRKGREIASNKTSMTRLVITLDEKGGLSRVQVVTSSGLEDLDDAALEALKIAAPFPNPPQDLIVDGFVLINWDFILES